MEVPSQYVLHSTLYGLQIDEAIVSATLPVFEKYISYAKLKPAYQTVYCPALIVP